MIADLARIKQMEFTHVWVNPFYEVCEKCFLDQNKVKSPYAMRDHTKLNSNIAKDFSQIKDYAEPAKNIGLIHVFDLVAGHVAIDNLMVTNQHPGFNEIDTSKWFRRHPNGNLDIKASILIIIKTLTLKTRGQILQDLITMKKLKKK